MIVKVQNKLPGRQREEKIIVWTSSEAKLPKLVRCKETHCFELFNLNFMNTKVKYILAARQAVIRLKLLNSYLMADISEFFYFDGWNVHGVS